MPVIGAGGVTTVEEGPVGVSDAAPHALSSDTAQSATVVRAGLVMTGMRFQTTGAKCDPPAVPASLLTRRNVRLLAQRRMSRASNITDAGAAHLTLFPAHSAALFIRHPTPPGIG
jgi:hypothetical protein